MEASFQQIEFGEGLSMRFRGEAPKGEEIKEAYFDADKELMEFFSGRERNTIPSTIPPGESFIGIYCTEKDKAFRIIHYGLLIRTGTKYTVFDNGYGFMEMFNVSEYSDVTKENKNVHGGALVTSPPASKLKQKMAEWYLVDINFLPFEEVNKFVEWLQDKIFWFSFIRNCRKTACCLAYSLCLKYPQCNFVRAAEWINFDSYDQFNNDMVWKRLRPALIASQNMYKGHVYQDVFNGLMFNTVAVFVDKDADNRGMTIVKVERAKDLYNADASRVHRRDKSDPFVKVFEQTKSGKWEQSAKTKTITDDLNPVWNESFFICSTNTALKFEVWDSDRLSSDDYLGTAILEGPEVGIKQEVEVKHQKSLIQDRSCKWKAQGSLFVTTQTTQWKEE